MKFNIFKHKNSKKQSLLKYSSWNTIPIGVFYELESISSDENLSEQEKTINIISILADKPIEEIYSMSIDEISKYATEISFIKTPVEDSIKKIKSVDICGVKYDVVYDMSKITYAQYVDFQTYYKLGPKYIPNLLATFIIPHGKTYNQDYDLHKVIDDFRDYLSITTANYCLNFFIERSRSSINRTLRYLRLIVKMMKTKKNKTEIDQILKKMKTMEQLSGSLF